MYTVKRIKSENHNGLISLDAIGTNSISFYADIPKNAVVDYVRLRGSFTVYGFEQSDKILEDIETPVSVVYHREMAVDNQRAIATVHFLDDIPADLIAKIQNYFITNFDIYYHDEAVTEVE